MPRRPGRRRGVAPIELLLGLPLILILMMFIVVMGLVSANRLGVSIRARREAWAARAAGPSRDRLGVVDPIGFGRLAGVPGDAGLVVREASGTVDLPRLFPDPLHRARWSHAVLAGPWDSGQIAFPARGPDVPDPRFFVFLDPFASLSP